MWLDHYFLWQCLWLGQGPRHLFTSRKALQSFKARLSQSFLSQVALQSCRVSLGGSFMEMRLLFCFVISIYNMEENEMWIKEGKKR